MSTARPSLATRSGLPPPPGPAVSLTTASAVAMAGATAAGAALARPMSLLVPAVLAAVIVAGRRPALLAIPVAMVASTMGARAIDGLTPPPFEDVDGVVTLVTDPETRWGTVEAIGRWDGRHLLVRAEGPAGEVLSVRSAGERLEVVGGLRPLSAREGWLRTRHVVARLELRDARAGPPAAPPWRAANRLRSVVADGAGSLGDDARTLCLGLLFGDDRGQSPELVDDFRGAGLSHLLAVSGQNVAFVIVLAGPVLRRMGMRSRLVALVSVLILFALVTRAEPSVLRAVVMAGAGAIAAARGRPTPALHLLGLCVTGLVLIDPLLVRSVGFQLSVAATAGILVLSPRLEALIPGPRLIAAPLAVSAGAQLAVSPLLVARFGGVPVAALPANLAADPLAGAVMVWGLPVGVVAGVLGEPWAGWAHAPTGAVLAALAAVARWGASLPLGEMGAPELVAATAGLVLVAVLRARPERSARLARRAGQVTVVAALVAPAVGLWGAPPVQEPHPGITVWRSGSARVVRVEPGVTAGATLAALRQAGVVRIDLLVVGPGSSAAEGERAARHRAAVGERWWLGPTGPVPGHRAVVGRLVVEAGATDVTVTGPFEGPESGR